MIAGEKDEAQKANSEEGAEGCSQDKNGRERFAAVPTRSRIRPSSVGREILRQRRAPLADPF